MSKKQKSPCTFKPSSANNTFAGKKQVPLSDEKNKPQGSVEAAIFPESVSGEDNKHVKADLKGKNKQTSQASDGETEVHKRSATSKENSETSKKCKVKILKRRATKLSCYFSYYQNIFDDALKSLDPIESSNAERFKQWCSETKAVLSEKRFCLMKKGERFCKTCVCQPNCYNIDDVKTLEEHLIFVSLFKNFDAIFSNKCSDLKPIKEDISFYLIRQTILCETWSAEFSLFCSDRGYLVGFKQLNDWNWERLREDVVKKFKEAEMKIYGRNAYNFRTRKTIVDALFESLMNDYLRVPQSRD